jgi:predicted lipoprotein with Yx(FWY)xxD motif
LPIQLHALLHGQCPYFVGQLTFGFVSTVAKSACGSKCCGNFECPFVAIVEVAYRVSGLVVVSLGQADGIMSALEGYYDKARDTVGDFYDRNERALKVAAALAAAGALGYGAYEAKRQLPDKIRALAVQKGMELYRQFRPRK